MSTPKQILRRQNLHGVLIFTAKFYSLTLQNLGKYGTEVRDMRKGFADGRGQKPASRKIQSYQNNQKKTQLAVGQIGRWKTGQNLHVLLKKIV